MNPIITFIYPIIRDDYIQASLESLEKFTDRSKYKLIIVDQTLSGMKWYPEDNRVDMVIRMKNQGFATASNTGIRVALSWNTPYIAVINDDVEFIYDKWLEDALEEFKTDPNIIAVNPECPRVPMWGYGMTNGEYLEILPYKDAYTPQDIAYLKQGDYNKEVIKSRHDFEIPESFPFTKRGVIDGFAGWLPIFKREGLIEKGLYDERFVWGGGEDYDLMGRVYSCAWPVYREDCDPKYHRRAVSTMKSWVWHHWGQSKDVKPTLDPRLFEGRESWNNLDELYPPDINNGNHIDPWGHWTDKDGKKKPFKRVKNVYIHIP